tara:strand:+ start:3975 stop:4241 length:267 start_codon:yes stop_codon:yes gene_type:complete
MSKKKSVKSTPLTEIKYIDKVIEVEVKQKLHPKTEAYLKKLSTEVDLSREQFIEAILFESEINSRRYGLFSVASKLHNINLRVERERG